MSGIHECVLDSFEICETTLKGFFNILNLPLDDFQNLKITKSKFLSNGSSENYGALHLQLHKITNGCMSRLSILLEPYYANLREKEEPEAKRKLRREDERSFRGDDENLRYQHNQRVYANDDTRSREYDRHWDTRKYDNTRSREYDRHRDTRRYDDVRRRDYDRNYDTRRR